MPEKKYFKEFRQIGLNIMYQRKQRGLTQSELAELADLSPNYLQRVETARSRPSVATLLSISYALKVPIASLFSFQI